MTAHVRAMPLTVLSPSSWVIAVGVRLPGHARRPPAPPRARTLAVAVGPTNPWNLRCEQNSTEAWVRTSASTPLAETCRSAVRTRVLPAGRSR